MLLQTTNEEGSWKASGPSRDPVQGFYAEFLSLVELHLYTRMFFCYHSRWWRMESTHRPQCCPHWQTWWVLWQLQQIMMQKKWLPVALPASAVTRVLESRLLRDGPVLRPTSQTWIWGNWQQTRVAAAWKWSSLSAAARLLWAGNLKYVWKNQKWTRLRREGERERERERGRERERERERERA